ncbi:MAG: PEP-CTERM motif protein [Candidatus Accumulibacter adjunctus]|uniref:PEP-CTERM motif protein n=1 Tax=Candidatus Accumulibacter adjunctus TaxID=1454001 RepID=A0A011N2A5_9PROT|nr:MAG: PEP-CTERM motif protein [Candidatus Accumulibacter adjunctus]
MELKNIAKVVAALGLAASLAAPAGAAQLNLTGYTNGGPSSVSVASPAYSGGAGQFSGTLDGNAFTTFCAELTQSFNFNTNYTYSIVSGTTAWTNPVYLGLSRLVTWLAANPTFNNSPDKSAAMQSAVWEVIYETSGTYNLAGGTFVATSSGATQTALNTLNGQWANINATLPTLFADKLVNANHQDFLLTTPVPEPEAFAMMLAGLGLVGAIARRRSRSGV